MILQQAKVNKSSQVESRGGIMQLIEYNTDEIIHTKYTALDIAIGVLEEQKRRGKEEFNINELQEYVSRCQILQMYHNKVKLFDEDVQIQNGDGTIKDLKNKLNNVVKGKRGIFGQIKKPVLKDVRDIDETLISLEEEYGEPIFLNDEVKKLIKMSLDYLYVISIYSFFSWNGLITDEGYLNCQKYIEISKELFYPLNVISENENLEFDFKERLIDLVQTINYKIENVLIHEDGNKAIFDFGSDVKVAIYDNHCAYGIYGKSVCDFLDLKADIEEFLSKFDTLKKDTGFRAVKRDIYHFD